MNTKQTELSLTDEMIKLIQRAEAGDRSAVPALRQLLDEQPGIWQQYGDLAQLAENAWLDLVAGPNLALRECLERKLAQVREELGEPSASPLERLLVRRVATCWLQMHHGDAYYAQLRDQNVSPAQVRVAERFQDRAHTRYLSAIKQLAQVRKLLRSSPSPLELATRSVEETAGHPAERRQRVTSPTAGLAVAN